jgi:hypothetical protein
MFARLLSAQEISFDPPFSQEKFFAIRNLLLFEKACPERDHREGKGEFFTIRNVLGQS